MSTIYSDDTYTNGAFDSGSPLGGYALGNALANTLSRVQSLGNASQNPNGINMLQRPKWNIYNPKEVYKHTNKEGNCTVMYNFGSVSLRLPAWRYANEDDEWGTSINEDSAGNVTNSNPSGTSSGVGILTPEVFKGKKQTHHLYMDMASHRYFYVVHSGHEDKSDGLEPKSRRKYPATIPNRLYEDAEIGSDDEWTKKNDPTYENTCIVGVPNPHLSKADFMRLVYPSYDDPMQKALALTSNPSTFLNEPIDSTKYTPYEDLSGTVNAAQLSSAQSKQITSGFSNQQSKASKTIGRDRQPLDPNFHVFRPVNTLAIETHPDMAAADIIGLSGGKYGHLQAWKLIEAYIANNINYSCGVGGGMSAQQYYSILNKVSPYRNLPSKGDPDYYKYLDPHTHKPIDLVALSIATGKSSFASTPLTKLNNLAPYQTSLAGYMFSRQYKYETLLFDYYADNSKFFSGTIDVTGRLGIEYGIRLLWYDRRRQYVWEFYVDGVSHSWSLNANGDPNPWITTISVERGLPFTMAEIHKKYRDPANGEPHHYHYDVPTIMGTMDHRKGQEIKGNFSKRFTGGFYGRQAVFTGGFFGEQTLASMVSQANLRNRAFMSHFGDSGNSSTPSKSSSDTGGFSKLISTGKKYLGASYGGEDSVHHSSHNPRNTDCSGFVDDIMRECGHDIGQPTSDEYGGKCKQVSKSDTGPGYIGGCAQHAIFLEEKWHGPSTRILNDGGAGHKVEEGSFKVECMSIMGSDWKFYKPW